jgi:hypothetical protein
VEGLFTDEFRRAPLDVRNEPWKRDKEVIGGEDAAGLRQRGTNGTKSVVATRGMWSDCPH